jgi:hypothetical protein
MAQIPSVKVWADAEVLTHTDLNNTVGTIRTTVNSTALFTDLARTVTEVLTFSVPPVFSSAQTFADAVTVTTGGLTITAGGLTVTAGASTFGAGVTVSAGGVTVTGDSSITGALTGMTGVTVTGTVTATAFAGSGADLTALPAAQLTGTLPALNGASLTALNASNIASGTLSVALLPTDLTTRTVTSLTVGPFTTTNAAFRLGSAASTAVAGDGGGSNPTPGDPGNLPSGFSYYSTGGGVATAQWLKFVDASGKACFMPYYREA